MILYSPLFNSCININQRKLYMLPLGIFQESSILLQQKELYNIYIEAKDEL